MNKKHYIYGTVLYFINVTGEKYFINLKTGDKVLALPRRDNKQKLTLIPCDVTKEDVEYAKKLEKAGLLSNQYVNAMENFKISAERKKQQKGKELSKYEKIAAYSVKELAYKDILNAIIFGFEPMVDEINYHISCGKDIYKIAWKKCSAATKLY